MSSDLAESKFDFFDEAGQRVTGAVLDGHAIERATGRTIPVHAIYDLHEAINILARKLLRQAQRQKTNILYQQTMSEDAAKLQAFDAQLTRLTRLHKLRIPAAPRVPKTERNGTPEK